MIPETRARKLPEVYHYEWTGVVKTQKFLEGECLPAGYFDVPDPYTNPPVSEYNIRAMVSYAIEPGKKVTDPTKEEARRFLKEKQDE